MYIRAAKPLDDNLGTTVNLMRRKRRGGMGDAWSDFVNNTDDANTTGGTSWSGGTLPETSTDEAAPDDVATTTGTTTTAADFINVGGVCKPRNFTTLNAVKAYQSQLNRVAQVKGFGKITADGDVGPGTLQLHKKVQSVSSGSVMGDPSSCMGVAPDVDVLADQVKQLADKLGAPATVDQATVSGSIINKQGIEKKPPGASVAGDLIGSFNGLSTIQKIAVVGAIGGIAVLLIGGKKKKAAAASRRSSHR